jgi:hypothetical protein
MTQSQQTQDLVCFDSFEQIRELKGYRPDNPLTIENYSRILGWYQFPKKCACCVRRESGTLCRTLHNNGWVALLQDGSVTILGRNCANDKFGADSSVFKDISLAINTIKARQRADRLRNLLSRRNEFEGRLTEASGKLLAARRRIDEFLTEIGPKFAKRIVAMARAGNSAVMVDAVRVRHYEEHGQSKKEFSTFKHRLGNLDGISALNNDQYIQLSISISNIRQAFAAAIDVQSLTRATQAALTTRLEECEPVLQRTAAIEEQVERFFQNSRLLFCFITDERGERSKLARLAMHQVGVDGGRDQAKEWLLGQEKGLLQQLDIQAIRILGA